MAIADIDERRPIRGQVHPHATKAREPSLFASLGMCLTAAILLGLAGWVAFEIFLIVITLD
jgi:hypothetical protein